MSGLLSKEDVIELTGYQRAAYQAQWLANQGIRHFINAQGRVIVPAAAIAQPANFSQIEEKGPDFSNVA